MRKSTFDWLVLFSVSGPILLGGWMLLRPRSTEHLKSHRVDADFNAIGSAVRTYVINAKVPPTTEQGLEALVTMPTTAPVPKRWSQMMKKVPPDPWMREYGYRRFSAAVAHYCFELRSAGPDGVFGNADDIAEVFER